MPKPMTKEEVTLSVNRIEAFNNDNSLRDGYDLILERICSYIDANVDDFIECYREEDEDAA